MFDSVSCFTQYSRINNPQGHRRGAPRRMNTSLIHITITAVRELCIHPQPLARQHNCCIPCGTTIVRYKLQHNTARRVVPEPGRALTDHANLAMALEASSSSATNPNDATMASSDASRSLLLKLRSFVPRHTVWRMNCSWRAINLTRDVVRLRTADYSLSILEAADGPTEGLKIHDSRVVPDRYSSTALLPLQDRRASVNAVIVVETRQRFDRMSTNAAMQSK
jgi:hypothetical protein